MRAMILAAGFGTRLRPLTLKTPKALLKVADIPLFEIIYNRLLAYGFTEIAVNTHHHSDQIENFVKKLPANHCTIKISREKRILGTGGGVKKMISILGDDQPILVHNVDVLTDLDLKCLFQYHIDNRAFATLAVQKRETRRYLVFDKNKQLRDRYVVPDQVNIPCSEDDQILLGFNGIQVIQPELFQDTKEQQFDSIQYYLKAIRLSKRIIGFRMDHYYWKDLGTLESLKAAEKDITRGRFLLK